MLFLFTFSSPVPEHQVLESSPIPQTRSQTGTSQTAPVGISRSLERQSSSQGHSSEEQPECTTIVNGTESGGPTVTSAFIRQRSSSSSSSRSEVVARPFSGRVVPAAPVIESMEFPFFVMQVFPPNFLCCIGGVVTSRSVKLLDKVESPDEVDTRDAWWAELRAEVKSHMRALACNAVVGYREETTIYDEIIVMSACGTAAVVELPNIGDLVQQSSSLNASIDKGSLEKEKEKAGLRIDTALANNYYSHRSTSVQNSINETSSCQICHVPYNESSLPFPVKIQTCKECLRGKVPDVIFATIDPPPNLDISGDVSMIQARLLRKKSSAGSESQAKEISDVLPFIEYELHNQLMAKLITQGKNAIFCLHVDISVGENYVIGLATGTALLINTMPTKPMPKIIDNVPANRSASKSIEQVKKALVDRFRSKKQSTIECSAAVNNTKTGIVDINNDEELLNDSKRPDAVLNRDKNTFVIELDAEPEPELLLEKTLPPRSLCLNTSSLSALSSQHWQPLHMICRFFRLELEPPDDFSSKLLSNNIDRLIQNTLFKYRRLKSVCIASSKFSISIPEDNEIQIVFCGMVLGECSDSAPQKRRTLSGQHSMPQHAISTRRFSTGSKSLQATGDNNNPMMLHHDDLTAASGAVFKMDDIHSTTTGCPPLLHSASFTATKPVMRRQRMTNSLSQEVGLSAVNANATHPFAVFLTPLFEWMDSDTVGYLGHYSFFFIRETTMLKELGGLNSFLQNVTMEILYVVRAYVAAIGGHGMVAFKLSQTELLYSPSRNHGQFLISVTGDIVTSNTETQ